MNGLARIIATLVIVSALSGCGAGTLSNAEFVAQANAACTADNALAQPLLSSPQVTPSPGGESAELLNSITKVIPIVQDLQRKLAALNPPAAKQAEYIHGLSLLVQLVSKLSEIRDALAANGLQNTVQLQDRGNELNSLGELLDSTAANLGLTECANIAHTQVYG